LIAPDLLQVESVVTAPDALTEPYKVVTSCGAIATIRRTNSATATTAIAIWTPRLRNLFRLDAAWRFAAAPK